MQPFNPPADIYPSTTLPPHSSPTPPLYFSPSSDRCQGQMAGRLGMVPNSLSSAVGSATPGWLSNPAISTPVYASSHTAATAPICSASGDNRSAACIGSMGSCGVGNSQTLERPAGVGMSSDAVASLCASSSLPPGVTSLSSLQGSISTSQLEGPPPPPMMSFPGLVGNSITRQHFTSLTTTAAFLDPASRPPPQSDRQQGRKSGESPCESPPSEVGGGICVEGRLVEGEYVNYWRVIPVRIKTGDREDFTASLTVKVFTCAAPTATGRPPMLRTGGHWGGGEAGGVGPDGLTNGGGSSCNQVLRVELTYEADPYFLFTLEVGESDFHVLKSEQRLLVNFQTFPAKFVELLEECVRQHHQEPSHPQRLIAIFISNGFCGGVGGRVCGGEAFLNLVESNQFRELTHLCLKFRQGNDEAVKRHLAKQLLYFKGHCEEVKRRLACSEENNRCINEKAEKLNANVQQMKSEQYCLRETLTAQHQQELTAVKESTASSITSIKQVSADQLARVEGQKIEQVSALEERALTAERRAEQLHIDKRALERSEGELNRQVEVLTAEAADRTQQLDRLREETTSLHTLKFQQEKLLAEMTVKLKGCQEQLTDKEALLRNSTSLIEQTKARSGTAEDALGAEKARCERAEEGLNSSIDEIRKGNEIIDKLQTQIRTLKGKLKQLQQANVQLEKTTSEFEVKIEGSQQKLEQAEGRRQIAVDKEASLKEELAQTKGKIDELHRELQTSREVTMRLNKELTNKQVDSYMCKFPSYSPSTSTTPSLLSTPPSDMPNYCLSKSPLTTPTTSSSSLEKLPPLPASTFASFSSSSYPHSLSSQPPTTHPAGGVGSSSLFYSFGGPQPALLHNNFTSVGSSVGSPPLTPSFAQKQQQLASSSTSAVSDVSVDLLAAPTIEYTIPPPTMRDSTGWLKAQ
eukprot:GHVS01024381.1.p1 GENE.GHVS01024381.1~~GHVS01024381.1.p1  ORF type:complete len:920 (+),score=200.85 GHVS01024381.1:67-2826(+)